MDRYSQTFELYDKLAGAYQDKFMTLDLYDDTYDAFCNALPSESEILEIGCGPGNITRYLLKYRPDLNILGIDMAPNMIELAKTNNPDADFLLMDCREINTIERKFNGIMCGFCLPYLSNSDVEKLLFDASGLLVDDGILYLSLIEGDYERSGYEFSSDGKHSVFVYLYDAATLIRGLHKNGFEVIHEFRKSYAKANGTTDTHLIIIAKKK